MTNCPRISVVIPAYNAEKFIGRTLQSVFDQKDLPDEVLVVDDGSKDQTVVAAEKFPVKVLRQKNQGPSAARNFGAQEATGDWVAFLDSDDEWLPERISLLKKAIANNPQAVLVANDDYEGNLDGHWTYRPLHKNHSYEKPLFPQLYRGNFIATSGTAVHRQTYLSVGGMHRDLYSAQDFHTWLKIIRQGPAVLIPQPLSRYLVRPHSVSSKLDVRLNESLFIADDFRDEVSLKDYAYRTAVCYYEAWKGYRFHKQEIKALQMVVKMPFVTAKKCWDKILKRPVKKPGPLTLD